ncbi:hypothetical protein PENTCL1PPCAC_102, partial [Pristionchus entomophagus]
TETNLIRNSAVYSFPEGSMISDSSAVLELSNQGRIKYQRPTHNYNFPLICQFELFYIEYNGHK